MRSEIAVVLVLCAVLLHTTLAVPAVETRILPAETYPDAKCLDGTQGGYHYRVSNASSNWIIYHQGGGWCYGYPDCYDRAFTQLGSNKYWKVPDLQGIYTSDPKVNPDYHDWNVIYIRYCDGSSYSSNNDPVKYKNITLWWRGKQILTAIQQDLFKQFPINSAKNIIVSGSSAGGLATYMHIDWWRAALPQTAHVAGLPDAGWFQDAPNVDGIYAHTDDMKRGFQNWGSDLSNDGCRQHYQGADAWKCVYAQYIYPFIKTPIFVLNSRVDSWQSGNILDLPCTYPNCSAAQVKELDHYGVLQYNTMLPVLKSGKDGIWSDACFFHSQSVMNVSWNSVKVRGDTIMTAFTKWYNGASIKLVDNCDLGCNPSCVEPSSVE